MATATVLTATALGLYIYSQRSSGKESLVVDEAQPPSTWSETFFFFKEVVRYAFGQTLGRWYTLDLFIGLAYLSHREALDYPAADIAEHGQLLVSFSEPSAPSADKEDSQRFQLQSMLSEMIDVRRYLLFCRGLKFKMAEQLEFWRIHLGIDPSRVLSQQPNAGLLRPAHALLVDDEHRKVLLCIRGTSHLKDLLTSLAATTKPHHKVQSSGVVLGYGHLGMLAAARFLLKQNRELITQTMKEHSDHRLVLVGHSMGAGIAVLLTMMLREMVPGCADAKCYAMACPACMTLELATSCRDYVTSIIHGTDIVPTFSAATVDALRDEVMHSSWFAEFQRDLQSSMFRAVQGGIRGVGTAGMWTARNILQPVAMPFRSCINQRGSRQQYHAISPSDSASQQRDSPSGEKDGEGKSLGSGGAQQLRRRLWPWGGAGPTLGFDAASSMSYAGWVNDDSGNNNNGSSSSEPSKNDGTTTPSKPPATTGWWWQAPLSSTTSSLNPTPATNAPGGEPLMTPASSSSFSLPNWTSMPGSSLLQACTNALGRKGLAGPPVGGLSGTNPESSGTEHSSLGAGIPSFPSKQSKPEEEVLNEEEDEEEEDDYEGGMSALERGQTAAVLLSSLGKRRSSEGSSSRLTPEVDSTLPAVGLIGPSDRHLEQGISAVVEAMAQDKGEEDGGGRVKSQGGEDEDDEDKSPPLPTSTSPSGSKPSEAGASTSASTSSTIRRHLFPAGRVLHLFPQVAVIPQTPDPDGFIPKWDPEGMQAMSDETLVPREEFTPVPPNLKPTPPDLTAARIALRQSPYVLYEVSDVTVYNRIKLCRTMVQDHLTPSYLTAVTSVIEQLEKHLEIVDEPSTLSVSNIPVSIDKSFLPGSSAEGGGVGVNLSGGGSRRRGVASTNTLVGPDGDIL